MRKLILITALASGLSLAGFSQSNDPQPMGNGREQRPHLTPDQRSERDAQWAESKLGLNADQKSKWQAASLERLNADEPLKEKMRGSTTPQDRDQIRSQMKSNADKFEATVSSFLTPEQKAKYDELKQQRHGARPMRKDKSAGQPDMSAPRTN